MRMWQAEWWQVAAATGVVAMAVMPYWKTYSESDAFKVETYNGSDAFKVEAAVAEVLKPFAPPPPPAKHVVPRPILEQAIKKRLETAHCETSLTIIAGQFQAGKTSLVNAALTGEKGVIYFIITSPDWKAELHSRLGGGTDDKLFLKVLEEAGKKLGHPPLLYLDIPRHSPVKMESLSTFCKKLVTDSALARVVVVASQLTFALGFDAGGWDVWVDAMTEAEAREFLSKNFPQVLSESDIGRIIKRVGTVPGTLSGLMKCITRKDMGRIISVDKALEDRYKTCMLQVAALRAMQLPDSDGKLRDVGKEIIQALLRSGEAEAAVGHLQWQDKGILVKDVAEKIAKMKAFAVSYNTERKRWHWASPMHREAAQKM